jgi:tripartite-type tricarboxylate transporter receptor subunit TctC
MIDTGPKALCRAAYTVALAAFLASGPSLAGDYPAKKLDYILHVKPGGATDVLARKLATALEDEMGVTIVVENRRGGSGAKQMAVLTRKDGDGATFGSVTASHLGMFLKTGNYNTDDVAFACRMVIDPYLLVVPGDSEIDNLSDLAATARANPGELSIAGFGEGSGGQIGWKIIEKSAGLTNGEIKWIPYDSVKEGIVAVLGKHNDVAIGYVGLTRQHVESGKLKVIGIMADTAPALMPAAVPFTEQGYEVDNNWQQFRGVIMPKDTPVELQEALCSSVKKVMEAEVFETFMANSGLNYGYQPPAEFATFVESQSEATGKWFDELGVGK